MATDGPPPAGAAPVDAPSAPRRPRWSLVLLAAAALASSWNPAAAPFGLVVGIVTAILAIRALRRAPERRRFPAAALGMSVLAIVASVIIVALTAGTVGVDLPGEPVVKGRSGAELDQVLSEAAGRTRERREHAIQELDAQRGRSGTPPGSGGSAPGSRRDKDRP